MKELNGFQKGVNLGGWLSQCVSYTKEHFDFFIVEDDIKKIADWGMDHIRLPIDNDVIETEDGTPIEEGMKHIDECLEWCKKYNLNVVLDLHKTQGYIFDNDYAEPDKFFYDKYLQERFYSLWDRLAKRYGKYRDMLILELLNEVVNPDCSTNWNQIARKAIFNIRKIEPDIKIMLGSVQHNSVSSITFLDPPIDKNIVWTFHCYEPLCFTHQKAHWVKNIDFELSYPDRISVYKEKTALLNQNHAGDFFNIEDEFIGPNYFRHMFKAAIAFADMHNVSLYCGEYGVIDQAKPEDAIRWLTDINKVFADYKIGRSIWTYKNKDFGMTDPNYASILDEMIKVTTS